MFKKFLTGCLLFLTAFTLSCTAASADKRVALIIGNGAYANKARLNNPQNDAQDVTAALKRSNFDVISATDLGQAEMRDAAIKFSRAAKNADIALFYYSGHAMQYNGVNYLMPIDAKLDDEADLKRFVRVDDIMADLQQAKNLRILVLDSCRDNPFADTLKRTLTRGTPTRGLSKIDAPLGTIVSFSTQSGQTAEDGTGRNSPYTAAFVRHIDQPKEIGDVFRDVSAEVYESSGKSQLPELSLSIIGKVYLNGPVTINVAPSSQGPAQGAPADPCASADAHWRASDSIGVISAYEDHIAKFPNCTFSNLARAKVEQLKQKAAAPPAPAAAACPARFDSGRYGASEMSCYCSPSAMTGTVWGTDIYTNDSSICAAALHAGAVSESGGTVRVRGAPGRSRYPASRRNGIATSSWDRWDGSFVFPSATGAATAATTAPEPLSSDSLLGEYSVVGTNPNGTSYRGVVNITSGGGGLYNFVWRIGSSQSYRGSGRLNGRTLTVNWGQSSPVIYQVQDNGVLVGRWSNGRATEDLTPSR